MRCNCCYSNESESDLTEVEEFVLCSSCTKRFKRIITCIVCDTKAVDIVGNKKFCCRKCNIKFSTLKQRLKKNSYFFEHEKLFVNKLISKKAFDKKIDY